MTSSSTKPGAALAEQLLRQSEQDAVVDFSYAGKFTNHHCFRLLARLWTLKRMLSFVYGGWTQATHRSLRKVRL